MARLWSCGFELQSVTNGVEMDTFSGTPAIDTTTKRSGAASLRLNPSASTKYAQKHITNTVTHLFARCWIYVASMPDAKENIFTLLDNDFGWWLGFDLTSAGHLTDDIGVDLAISTGQWYKLEIEVESSGAGDWSIVFNSGTVPGSNGYTSNSWFINLGPIPSPWTGGTGAGTFDIYFDDIAVNDTSGAVQNSWAGDGKNRPHAPNGARG